MLFRVRTEGQADIDKLAASVRGVSGVTALASDGLANLERSILALTASVNENTIAVSGAERGFDGFAGGARRAGEAARHSVSDMQAASAAIRGLEGSMNVRAAERFITTIGGIGPVLQAAFPVFGAVALVGVLDSLMHKAGLMPSQWNAVTEAQKESFKELEKQSKKYDELLGKLKKLRMDEYERSHGKEARQELEIFDKRQQADGYDAQQVEMLRQQVEVLRKATHYGFSPTEHEAFLGNMAGVGKTSLWGLSNSQWVAGSYPDPARAKELLPEFEARLRTASVNRQVDQADVNDEQAKLTAEQRKTRDEEAKKRQRELDEAEKQAAAYLRSAQTFELTGLERINEVYREKLALLGKTPKAVQDINAAYAIEVQRETAKEVKKGAEGLQKSEDWWKEQAKAGHATYDAESGGWMVTATAPHSLRLNGYSTSAERADRSSVDAMLKLLQGSDDSDADSVRRGLGATLKRNTLSARGGHISGSDAAGADYAARIAAADAIFKIETQHLDLYDKEGQAAEKLASARRKYADEQYRAEEQYQTQLQALRERDLQKYQGMAGSLFDSLRGHSTSQWMKDLLVGQGRAVFTNAVTPVLQQAGHALGSIVPANSPIAGMLHGTLLDPANKGVDSASTTAKETKRTADEVHALRSDIRAMGGAPAATGTADGGAGIGLPSMKGMSPLDMLTYGSDITGGWGTQVKPPGGAASLLKGSGSTISQFFSGMAGMGNNPLEAIFTGQAHGDGWGANLSTSQRVGAAVGTGAALFGAGMGIYSGIQQGGVGGYAKATASGLGAAAMLDPEPISKAILGTVASVAGIVGVMFGTGPEKRSKEISEYLSKNQYLAPTALNVMQGMDGTYQDFGARGNLRTSSFSAVPMVAEAYITSRVTDGQRQYYNAPGGVIAPYGGGASGNGQAPIAGTVNNYYGDIHAMDASTFHQFLRKPSNAHSVGEAAADHLERHDGRLANAVRFITGN